MNEQDQPLLQISDLNVGFKTQGRVVEAVKSADLTIYAGQTAAIVGESGSGKSTLAHSIMRLLPENGRITGGSIRFGGRELATLQKSQIADLRGRMIGLVPQDPMSNLNPLWRIGFQIKEALSANRVAKGSEANRRVVELLEEAGLPDAARRARQYPHEFSGGMRQRALIAMGLATRPTLLVADEPTSALDVTVQHQILNHLDTLTTDLGVAVLFITHDLGLAAERAEHLVVMYRGRVVESGPTLDILQDPQHSYTRRLVKSAPSLVSRRLESEHAGPSGIPQADQTPAPGAAEPAPAAAESASDLVLQASNLTKTFAIRGELGQRSETFTAVDDVSFAIQRGTTTALVGESGSGKSTVAQLVLRLLPATSGTVLFNDEDISGWSGRKLLDLRRRMQPIFQNPYGTLDPMYSIYKTIEEPLVVHGIGTARERRKEIFDLLDNVAMPASAARRFPNELSGGQRQRIAIARALALSPEVVICDEAVSALDVLVQDQILKLLHSLQGQLGLSYLFITHDLAVVRQFADNVLVMHDGRLLETAPTEEVFENPQQEYTKQLLEAIPGADIPLGAFE